MRHVRTQSEIGKRTCLPNFLPLLQKTSDLVQVQQVYRECVFRLCSFSDRSVLERRIMRLGCSRGQIKGGQGNLCISSISQIKAPCCCLPAVQRQGALRKPNRQRQAVRPSCSSESSAQQTEDAAASPKRGSIDVGGDADAALKQQSKQGRSAENKMSSFVKNTATTFAPRASTATRNPAYRGSTLYTIFGVQAWVSLLVGGLLSFNIIFPTDKPSIARLIGMWSVWMFTIPAFRARECTSAEKEALNILFLLVPLLNVGLPFIWKSFPFIFSADCVALGGVYLWKIGLPAQQDS